MASPFLCIFVLRFRKIFRLVISSPDFDCTFHLSPIAPCECAEERRARLIRACTCLSRRRVCTRPRLDRAPQVARSAAEGRRHQGRLLFAYFLLAKQEKVSRPLRRQSGIRTHQGTLRSIKNKLWRKFGHFWPLAQAERAPPAI